MDTLEQRFMAILQEMSNRDRVPFMYRVNHGYRLQVRSIHLENYYDVEYWTIELVGVRQNTDIEGTAVDANQRELNA